MTIDPLVSYLKAPAPTARSLSKLFAETPLASLARTIVKLLTGPECEGYKATLLDKVVPRTVESLLSVPAKKSASDQNELSKAALNLLTVLIDLRQKEPAGRLLSFLQLSLFEQEGNDHDGLSVHLGRLSVSPTAARSPHEPLAIAGLLLQRSSALISVSALDESKLIFLLNVYRYYTSFLAVSDDLFHFISNVLLKVIDQAEGPPSKRNAYYETVYKSLLTLASSISAEPFAGLSAAESDRLKHRAKIYAVLLYARIRAEKLSPSLLDLALSTGRSLLEAGLPSLDAEFKRLVLSEIVFCRIAASCREFLPSLGNVMDLAVSFAARPPVLAEFDAACRSAFQALIGKQELPHALLKAYYWLKEQDVAAAMPWLPKHNALRPQAPACDPAMVDWFVRQILHDCRSACTKKGSSAIDYKAFFALHAWTGHLRTSLPASVFVDSIYALCKSISESDKPVVDASWSESYLECIAIGLDLQTEKPSHDLLLKLCHTVILVLKAIEPASEPGRHLIEKSLVLWKPFTQIEPIRNILLKLVDTICQACLKLATLQTGSDKWLHGLGFLLDLPDKGASGMENCVFERCIERFRRWLQSGSVAATPVDALLSSASCKQHFWPWMEKWLQMWSDASLGHTEPLYLLVSALVRQPSTAARSEMVAYYALPLASRPSEQNKILIKDGLLPLLTRRESSWPTHCLLALIGHYHAADRWLSHASAHHLNEAYTMWCTAPNPAPDWQSKLLSKSLGLCLALGRLALYIRWTGLLLEQKWPVRIERLKIAYDTGLAIPELDSYVSDESEETSIDAEQGAKLVQTWRSLCCFSKEPFSPRPEPVAFAHESNYVSALLLAKKSHVKSFQAHKACLAAKAPCSRENDGGGEWAAYVATLRNLLRMTQLAATIGNYKLAFTCESQLGKLFAGSEESTEDYWRLEWLRVKALIRLKAKLLSAAEMEQTLTLPVDMTAGVGALAWRCLKAEICHQLGTTSAKGLLRDYLSEGHAEENTALSRSIQDTWRHVLNNRYRYYGQRPATAIDSERLLQFSVDEFCLYLLSSEPHAPLSSVPALGLQRKMLQSRTEILASVIEKEKWNMGPWILRTLVDEYLVLKQALCTKSEKNAVNWVDWFELRLNVGYQRELALAQQSDVPGTGLSLQERLRQCLPTGMAVLALSISSSTLHKTEYVQGVVIRHGAVKYCRFPLHSGTLGELLEEWKSLLALNRSSTSASLGADGEAPLGPSAEAEAKARWWQARMQIDDKVRLWCKRAQSGLLPDSMLDAAQKPSQGMNPFVAESRERESLILVLDGSMNGLPFENFPLLRDYSVSRMPTLSAVCQALEQQQQLKAHGAATSSSLVYVLNPTGDLSHTEELFRPKLQSRPEWKGAIGKSDAALIEPLTSQVFQQGSIFLYFGHGTGELYLKPPPRDLTPNPNSLLILMGCSSGALTLLGDFEPSSPPFSYFCHTRERLKGVLVNLWDVTDRDIDRYSESLFSAIGLFEPEPAFASRHPTIAHAVRACRQACRLKWLVGCAPVFYGLPDVTI